MRTPFAPKPMDMSYRAWCLENSLSSAYRNFSSNLFDWLPVLVEHVLKYKLAQWSQPGFPLMDAEGLAAPSHFQPLDLAWGQLPRKQGAPSLIVFLYLQGKVITAFSVLYRNLTDGGLRSSGFEGFLFKSAIPACLSPKLWRWFNLHWRENISF